MRLHHMLWAALFALSLTACGSEDEPAPMDPPDDHMVGPVECSDAVPEMREGMIGGSRDGKIEAELVSADKIPLGWYHNDWIIRFTDVESGEPIENVMFGLVRPWMPLHRHDGNGQFPTVTDLDDGEWSFEGLNITMGGEWEIQIPIDESSAGSDYIVFTVCNSQPKPSARE